MLINGSKSLLGLEALLLGLREPSIPDGEIWKTVPAQWQPWMALFPWRADYADLAVTGFTMGVTRLNST